MKLSVAPQPLRQSTTFFTWQLESMTSYSGKVIPSKEVVNKEPKTSTFNIERQYRRHREKLLEIGPTVDDRAIIPEFMKNQAWKKHEIKVKNDNIASLNEGIYKRLTKVETSASKISIGRSASHFHFVSLRSNLFRDETAPHSARFSIEVLEKR